MKPSTEDEITGRVHEVKGTIKEKVGKLTNDPDLEGEGIGEKIAGKIQKKIGQVEKVIDRPVKPAVLRTVERRRLMDVGQAIDKNWRQVMNLSDISTTQMAIGIAIVAMALAGIAIWLFIRKRRTARLRAQFGGAEYSRAIKEGGGQRQAEAALDKRAERVEAFHIRPLAPSDRARFIESLGQNSSEIR